MDLETLSLSDDATSSFVLGIELLMLFSNRRYAAPTANIKKPPSRLIAPY
jgi:hypothetical protein